MTSNRGPGRLPGDFIRIERIVIEALGHSQDRDVEAGIRNRSVYQPRLRLRVYIGKALWRAIGEPGWIKPERQGITLLLVPAFAPGEDCYRVVVGAGMPRAWVDGARPLFENVIDGRYDARVHNGVLLLGARRPEADDPFVGEEQWR